MLFRSEVIFHRVIKGFMIQGGDPQGIGIGGPGYSIKGEFAQNGFKNDLAHAGKEKARADVCGAAQLPLQGKAGTRQKGKSKS